MATIICAPNGFKSLRRGVSYYLIRSCPVRQRVLLVSLVETQKKRGAPRTRKSELTVLSRADYESGLVAAKVGDQAPLVVSCDPEALPSWLDDLKGISFASDERFMLPRGKNEQSLRDEVLARLAQIQPALKDINAILLSDDPDKQLNRLARSLPKPVNEVRYRLWFYTYLAFDQRIWALLPPRPRCGRWNRMDEQYAESTFGRPSEHLGKMFGFRTTPEMIGKIIEGYRKYIKECGTLRAAWAKTVRKQFGGKVEKMPDGRYAAGHPEGQPMPSYDKFRYYAEKRFSKAERQHMRFGDERYRTDVMPYSGTLIDGLMNTGQRAHLDAQQVFERPKAYLMDGHLAAIRRVDLVDATTGQIQGVGFSLGSETAESYRLALFCAAIPKDVFGRLLGLAIDRNDWPSVGLPAEILTDGGPGAGHAVERAVKPWALAVDQAPAYQPMSNSVAEAKHGRRHRKAGAPEVVLSNLTVIEMIKRDVRNVIRKNRTDDAGRKAPDRAVVERGVATPNELYQWMADRHRTSLIQIPFDDAVRAFLRPVEMHAEDGWLRFRGHRYAITNREEAALAVAVRSSAVRKAFRAYVIPLAPLFAFVEYGGKLIEVRAVGDEHDNALYVTEEEAKDIQAARSQASGRRQANLPLEELAAQEEFLAATGKEWHGGRTRRGRPKDRTPEKRNEARMLDKQV